VEEGEEDIEAGTKRCVGFFAPCRGRATELTWARVFFVAAVRRGRRVLSIRSGRRSWTRRIPGTRRSAGILIGRRGSGAKHALYQKSTRATRKPVDSLCISVRNSDGPFGFQTLSGVRDGYERRQDQLPRSAPPLSDSPFVTRWNSSYTIDRGFSHAFATTPFIYSAASASERSNRNLSASLTIVASPLNEGNSAASMRLEVSTTAWPYGRQARNALTVSSENCRKPELSRPPMSTTISWLSLNELGSNLTP
jgi:hypothetical protein